MKRSDALELITRQLEYLDGKPIRFEKHTADELARAEVLLSSLEFWGMQPPNVAVYRDNESLVEARWETENDV